ncbi:MAG TPA: hypothetical protein VIH91_07145 [Terriglobales bacterium]
MRKVENSMTKTAIPETPAKATVQLDHILTSAVFLNWEALTASPTGGQVRIEYHIGAGGSVEYLTIWGSAREYWSLICNYSVNPGWSDGPSFSNGYHSRTLGRLLQSIMMNQNLFFHGCKPNTNGTLQIGAPSLQDTDNARLRVNETFQRPS